MRGKEKLPLHDGNHAHSGVMRGILAPCATHTESVPGNCDASRHRLKPGCGPSCADGNYTAITRSQVQAPSAGRALHRRLPVQGVVHRD